MVPLENSMEANDDNSVKIHTSKTACDETTNAEVIICKVSRLQQENETLRSNMMCKICLDARVGKLFLPCRHLVCCEECSARVRKCPLCRERIVGTITTFLYCLKPTGLRQVLFCENTYDFEDISKVLGRVS